MAQSGHTFLHRKCPLSGVKRTYLFAPQMSANDQSGHSSGDLGLPVRICQGGILNRDGRWRSPLPQVEHTHSGNHCHDEDKHTRR